MTSFTKMRENMILGQFLPGLIKNKSLLKVFSNIAREDFLDEKLKPLSYSDLNIKIKNDRYLVSPFNFAKILETCNIDKKDMVLLIGSAIGYETIILSKLAGTIIAMEEDNELYNIAENNLKKYDLDNVINVNCPHFDGYEKHAPYDLIIILGTIDALNKKILYQLSDKGRLLTCTTLNPSLEESKLTIYYKHKNNYVNRILFDLNLPKLITLKESDSEFKLIS